MNHPETNTILEALDVNSIKDQLRACWQRGSEWRLEFGRLLTQLRAVTGHGEWIKFLESEFGLHRQTAHNWMLKAKEADGVPIDEEVEQDDQPDEYASEVKERIADERAERDEKSSPRRFKMVLVSVSPDEISRYNEQMKTNRAFVQNVLRKAFEEILAGPTPTGNKMVLLDEDGTLPIQPVSDMPVPDEMQMEVN